MGHTVLNPYPEGVHLTYSLFTITYYFPKIPGMQLDLVKSE